jgi:N4-gp56 family major capsid protein
MTLVDTARTEAADYWNGGYITFTNPMDSNYGVTVKIATSVVGTLTFATPLKYATQANISRYRLVVGTGVTASSSQLTSEALMAAIRDLKTMHARPMKDGKYVCILDPYVAYDFMHDADWKAAATYKDSAKNLYNGEIGTWLNIRFVSASLTYRETQAGVYDREDGDIHVITLLGEDAYGTVGLGSKNVKMHHKSPDQLAQSLPSYSTVAWEAWFTTKTLNATFGINILCGASK